MSRPPLAGPPRLRRTLLAATAVAAAAIGLAAAPAAAGVPAAPAGWTPVWSDDFTGSAGSAPSSANWIVDTGHGYAGGPGNWGTGEIQSYTSSAQNLALDGTGNLKITPLRDASGNWTSGRVETRKADFKPPSGGVLRIEGRIQMPNITGT